MARIFRFDRAYYDRFYRDPETRVAGPDGFRRLGEFVGSYLRYLGIEVRSVLDFGCGVGHWAEVIAQEFPTARYQGVELSQHLCDLHGWKRGSVEDFPCRRPADLVVCQGVLQYLPAPRARRAIRNLARHTGRALYLEALTREDWDHNCDQSTTDGDVFLRSADWYRQALARPFISCGGGLFLPRDTETVLYELERAGR